MNYNIIKETTCKSIGIGYIVRCQSNDSIGIIYGARNSEYRTQLTDDSIVKMFFFKKDNQTEYPPYTIISYLQERETCCYPDRTIEVTNVIPLDNFIIYDKSADSNDQIREDGCYHCDLEWKLMSEAKPYAELSHTELCINLPYIHPKEKNVEYYNYTVYDCPNTSNSHLGSICSIFYTIKFFSFHKNVFSIAHIAEKLDDIKKYVNDFNVIEESKKFIAGESGIFQSRPGRDDHFNITTYKRTSSTDSYIKGLVKLEESLEYYSLNGRGIDDEDYDNIDEEKTTILRSEVKKAYNKNAHYFHLVDEFISYIKLKQQAYERANKLRNKFIDSQDKHLFQSCNIKDIDGIYRFNELHHRVSLK